MHRQQNENNLLILDSIKGVTQYSEMVTNYNSHLKKADDDNQDKEPCIIKKLFYFNREYSENAQFIMLKAFKY